MSRVTSSASGGLVQIQDTSGNSINSTGGSLNVNVTRTSVLGTVVSMFSSTSGVAMGSSSLVFSYTVPSGTLLSLSTVMISSDSVSQWDIQFNSVLNARKRLTYGLWNDVFNYDNYVLNSGDSIKIIATNNSQESVAEFDVTLIGNSQTT